MRPELGQYIAMIVVGSGAVILGLSYTAAYLIGRAHGRREERRSAHAQEQMDAAQRIAAVESSIHTLNASVERLMDAQRLLVAQQDHLSRKVGLTSDRMGVNVVQGHRTPS